MRESQFLHRRYGWSQCFDGRPAGRITSACLSPSLGHNLALAMLEAWASSPGTRVMTDDGEAGAVTELPFWRPGETYEPQTD